MEPRVTPFLMFQGRAEEAVQCYASLFLDANVERVSRYGPEGPGREGAVSQAVFSIKGQRFLATDSPIPHDFGFTPALSLFVRCDNEAEIEAVFTGLARGGEVLMPLGAYPFAERFAWVQDRFGVSWQLSLGA